MKFIFLFLKSSETPVVRDEVRSLFGEHGVIWGWLRLGRVIPLALLVTSANAVLKSSQSKLSF
jgi:hypothetical protein